MSGQMNSESTWGAGKDKHIDINRPIKVMANGPDGLAISDNRSRINGVVVLLPDGIRLPATSAHGRECQTGKKNAGKVKIGKA